MPAKTVAQLAVKMAARRSRPVRPPALPKQEMTEEEMIAAIPRFDEISAPQILPPAGVAAGVAAAGAPQDAEAAPMGMADLGDSKVAGVLLTGGVGGALMAPQDADAAGMDAVAQAELAAIDQERAARVEQIAQRERMQTFRNITEAGLQFAAKLPLNITRGVWEGFDNALGLVGIDPTQEAWREISPSYGEFGAAVESALGKETGFDTAIQEMAQWGVGFGAYLKGLTFLSGSSKATTAQALAADIAAGFTTMDPHIERLAGTLREFGLEYDLLDYLASQDGTEAENRFRNAVETAGLGVVGVVAFHGARALRDTYRLGVDMSVLPRYAASGSGMAPVRQAGGAVAAGAAATAAADERAP